MPSKQEIIDAITEIDNNVKGLNSMNKAELEELYSNLSTVFDTKPIATLEKDVVPEDIQKQTEDQESPNICDPEWTDWVLSQMEDYEKEGGNPKVDGLRRIANKYLGFFSCETKVHQTPDNSNGGRATITVNLYFPDRGLSYTGAADVYSGNTNKDFARHAVATAETRAEGRALKRALCLTKVISAEEVYDKNLSELSDGNAKAGDAMIKGFQMQAQKQGIDPFKLAVYNEIEIEDVKQLTRSQVQHLSAKVSMYHRGEEDVPEGIKS